MIRYGKDSNRTETLRTSLDAPATQRKRDDVLGFEKVRRGMYQLGVGKNRSGIDLNDFALQRNRSEKNCQGIVEIGMAQAMASIEERRQSMECQDPHWH